MNQSEKHGYTTASIFVLLVLLFIGVVQFIIAVEQETKELVKAEISDLPQVEEIVKLSPEEKQFNGELNTIAAKDAELALTRQEGVFFSSVQIPLLASRVNNTEIEGKQRACDTVVMINRPVKPTQAPLTAALHELFSYNRDVRYEPGNFAVTQKDIFFHGVRIENRTAKIYLLGKVGPINGVCDQPRLRIQLEEVALQYPTVDAVEIYLNEQPLNDLYR